MSKELDLEHLRRDMAVVDAKIEMMDRHQEQIGKMHDAAVVELHFLMQSKRDLLERAERMTKP